MEKGEEQAQIKYSKISRYFKDARAISEDEIKHEKQLIGLIDEDRLRYITSMVRGVNDALISTTGALAGFTLVFQNTRLIATAGFITGITAALSIAASDYLAIKSGDSDQSPFKSSFYTSSAFLITVLFLIFPYLISNSIYLSLGITILNAIIIIFIITYYISIVQDVLLRKRFFEMAIISLGIATLAFIIGYLLSALVHIDL